MTAGHEEATGANIIPLTHGKSSLALHLLREGWGRPLLLLHGLGERTPVGVPAQFEPWEGPIYGLDFTGHGSSSLPVGGGYTAEILMADVDAALGHLGKVTIHGRGLGAYVALLIAGARPTDVRGVILADGPGLVGGGIRPGSPHVPVVDASRHGTPDPYALSELSRDVRPPDYALEFVRQIMQWSELDSPIAVATVVRPEWLAAVVAEPGVIEATVAEALTLFADAR
ncbi:MAG: alpha/beta hydrolase [Actinobacteria bacterium]|nr:alpha/beta hydrolase [Actinomycetota bacterium]